MFSIAVAQSSDVRDTIKAVAHNRFEVPEKRPILLRNVLRVDYSAELLDAQKNKIRDIKTFTQSPSEEDFKTEVRGGRGTTLTLVIHEEIGDVGTYYVRLKLRAQSELGSKSDEALYMIIIDYPSMASAPQIEPNYFYGDAEAFSIATQEFTDPSKYSYSIKTQSGEVVEEANGSVVRLNSLLQKSSNVGKSFVVTALYAGQPFSFKDISTGTIKEAKWQFNLLKPERLDEINAWVKLDDPAEEWLLSPTNFKSKVFRYLYTSRRANTFITATPEIKGLKVTSDPPEFLKSFSSRVGTPWLEVIIEPNENYLDYLGTVGSERVTITVSFSTKFEKKEFKYKADLIR